MITELGLIFVMFALGYDPSDMVLFAVCIFLGLVSLYLQRLRWQVIWLREFGEMPPGMEE